LTLARAGGIVARNGYRSKECFMGRRSLWLALVLLVSPVATGCAGTLIVGAETAPGVVYLGERIVDFRVDHDVLPVASDTGAFRHLRFVVHDAPVAVYDVHIEFGNGQVVDVPTRLMFGRGTESREIDLPGDHRHVRSIRFLYETLGHRHGRAHVEVYGVR
jgi:hypothetical protein